MVNEVKLKLSVEGAQAARGEIDSVNTTVGKMASGALTAAKAMTGVFAGFAASQTIGKLISVQREFDVLNSSLITVTGSSANAAKEFAWIKQFAATTPYQLNEVTGAFVKMKALGLDASAKALTSYGNTASAMGKDLNQMIEAVADAATGEFERLKEFGIKASKQGDQVSLTFQGVTKTIGNSAGEITGYLQAIGNNEFAGAMATRAATLDGAISNLADNWDALYRTVSSGAVGGLIFDSVTVASEAIKSAEGAVKSVAEAIIPATKVAAAYFAIFVAAPAIYTMATAAMTPLIHATALHAYNMITGQAATIGLNTSLYGTSVAAQLAAGSLSKMALAGSALFAAFAGWQFGTYLRDQFVEVRVAGLAFIGAMMSGWEHFKYGAQLAGAALKSLLPGTESFAAAKARLSKEHAAEIDLIDQNIVELIQYETTVKSVTAAESASVSTKKAVTAATQAQLKAAEDLRKSYTAQAQALGDARNKEYDDIEKYMAAQRLAAIEAGNAADASVRAAQLELDQRGMLKSAIADTTVARLQDQLTTKTAGTEAYDSLVRQIEAQKQLADIYRKGETLDATDDLAKENKKAAEASEKYWEDALMRAFESGKGFFESLWDTIKNTLKTQVLKVMVQGVMGTLGIGAAGAAAAGTGGGTDILGLANMASSVSNAYNGISGLMTIGSQTLAGTMSAANALGTIAANATGTGISGLLATNGAYGTAAAGSASAGLAAIPGWGWAALGVAALAGSGLFDGGGGPKSSSAYNTAGVYDSDTSKTSLAATYGRGVEDAWASLAKQLELTTQLKVGTFVSIDSAGDAMTQLATSGTVNGQQIYSRAGRGGGYENVGRSEEALQAALAEEATRILFAALKASDLPEQYKTYLNSIADSADAMNVAIGNVSLVRNFTKALESLPFENLKNLGFDAAKGLIEMAGGLENLTAGMGTYYELFYTDAERIARTADSVSAALAVVGVTMPTTKDAFRAVVDGLNVATESGRATYVTMMALAPAFAQVADAAEKSAQDSIKLMTDVFDALEKRLTDLVDNIASERESVAGARDSILNGGPKTYAELQAGIAGAKVAMPSDARVLAANAAVAVAAANVAAQNNAVNQAKSLTPDAAALDAAKATLTAAKATTAQVQASVDFYKSLDGGRFGRYVDMGAGGFNAEGWRDSGERNAVRVGNAQTQATAAQITVQAAYDAQLASYNAALAINAGKVAAAQAVLAAATAAQTAAQANAKAAVLAYADAMTQYSGDAEKAVKVLGTLREQTVAYYEAQKELAGLMTTSAASLREAVRSTRFGQLDSAASLAQQQGAFAQNYSMALSTTGATKAGYADKLGAALPGLSAALMDVSATRSDWAMASANLLAQSETISAQLEAEAGGMNYEADSLALLDSIDVALGELDSNTAILKNAIDGGTSTTAAGLRAIVSQLGGVPAFAGGGYHSGGARWVGENGPELEVTGPSRIFNASQLRGSGIGNTEKLEALVQTLIADNTNMRAELRAIAIASSKTAKILERVTPDGNALQTAVAA